MVIILKQLVWTSGARGVMETWSRVVGMVKWVDSGDIWEAESVVGWVGCRAGAIMPPAYQFPECFPRNFVRLLSRASFCS